MNAHDYLANCIGEGVANTLPKHKYKAALSIINNLLNSNVDPIDVLTHIKVLLDTNVDYTDPITNLKELMRRAGYKQKDLICIFKTASIASEVLSCKRALTVEHIRGLSKLFNVSADLFI